MWGSARDVGKTTGISPVQNAHNPTNRLQPQNKLILVWIGAAALSDMVVKHCTILKNKCTFLNVKQCETWYTWTMEIPYFYLMEAVMKQTSKMSRTVGQLEKMYNTISAELFDNDLPETVITVTRTRGSYGHSSVKKVWTKAGTEAYELNISSETLALPIAETLDTLIHEMIHLHCRKHDLHEVGSNGYYHNKLFKQLAEEKHLVTVDTGKYGWNTTADGNDWLTEYAITHDWPEFMTYQKRDIGAELVETLAGLTIQGETKTPMGTSTGGKKGGSYIRWQCPKCKAIIRSTKRLNVICGDCNETFVET